MEITSQAGQRLPSLTSLRVFAALFVMLHHCRETWQHWAPVRWIGEVGWLGVSFFFILSGFVLMWSYDGRTPYRHYVMRRLVRIYPLHVLCFCVSFAVFIWTDIALAGYAGSG